MKRFFSLAVLVLTIVALAAGCSKDDDNPVGNGNNNSTAAMTGKIDGANWKSTVAEATIQEEELDILGVQGDSTASLSLQFTISNFQGKGTYQLDGMDNSAYIIDLARGGTMTVYSIEGAESETGGELVVTDVTATSIKGTFHFTAENTMGTNTKSVTNGVFTVKLH